MDFRVEAINEIYGLSKVLRGIHLRRNNLFAQTRQITLMPKRIVYRQFDVEVMSATKRRLQMQKYIKNNYCQIGNNSNNDTNNMLLAISRLSLQ